MSSINDFADGARETLARSTSVLDWQSIAATTVRERRIANIAEGQRQTPTRRPPTSPRSPTSSADQADDIDQIDHATPQRTCASGSTDASVRVDGILAKVDKLLGSGEAEGVMADASETLKSFKQVADTLNSRLGTITDGLARFSGQGLRDVEALVRTAAARSTASSRRSPISSAIRSASSPAETARSASMTAGPGVDIGGRRTARQLARGIVRDFARSGGERFVEAQISLLSGLALLALAAAGLRAARRRLAAARHLRAVGAAAGRRRAPSAHARS